jgi:ribosomal protein S18 acetylase RimI-like enzyme
MQIRKSVFYCCAIISLATQFYSNAMLISKKTSTQSSHQHKAKFCCNKISAYNHERDEKIVTQIALQHLPKLMSDVTANNKNEMLQGAMNTINGSSTISKVYLIDGKPIGFINYYIGSPWTIKNTTIMWNANINFLAIDDEHRGKGAGTALLNDALDDLNNRSVHTVTLMTTDYALANYYSYSRFGFSEVGLSKTTGVTKFMKRFKPHPVKLISKAMYENIFKNKE